MTSKHTKLFNYMIGFCKNEPHWICPLAELKYEPSIIEQSIAMKDGSRVTPDIVFASNKQQHILVCECKGGITLDEVQIMRYKNLTISDLLRWVRLHTKEIMHDVCYVMFESDHQKLSNTLDLFPILTFSTHVKKYGNKFVEKSLQAKFSENINIEHYVPPLSYYPFSSDDDKYDIIPYVLRAIADILNKNESICNAQGHINYDQILYKTHRMYKNYVGPPQKSIKVQNHHNR